MTFRQRSISFRWVVMTLIVLIYALVSADRANIGIVLPFIKKEFDINNTEAGAIASLFFIGYSITQLPAGFLVRRYGTRAVGAIFLTLTSIVTAVLGAANSAFAVKALRLILGIVEAPIPVSMLATINNWFPPRERGLATGLFISAAKIGPFIVPIAGAFIIHAFSWHYVFFFCAIPGFILAVLWLALVPTSPAKSRYCSPAEINLIAARSIAQESNHASLNPAQVSAHRTWLDRLIRARKVAPLGTTRELLASWDIWGNALSYMMMVGILNMLLAWLPTYLTDVKHLAIVNVGFVAAAPFAGAILGSVLGGWMSDYVLGRRRKPVIIVTCISTIVTMYLLTKAPNGVLALGSMLFVTGILLNLGFWAYPIFPAGLTTKHAYPIAAGLTNALGQIGGVITPFVAGWLLDHYDWNTVFLFLSASSLAALFLTAMVAEPIDYEASQT